LLTLLLHLTKLYLDLLTMGTVVVGRWLMVCQRSMDPTMGMVVVGRWLMVHVCQYLKQ
jgi:hypothetical protein